MLRSRLDPLACTHRPSLHQKPRLRRSSAETRLPHGLYSLRRLLLELQGILFLLNEESPHDPFPHSLAAQGAAVCAAHCLLPLGDRHELQRPQPRKANEGRTGVTALLLTRQQRQVVSIARCCPTQPGGSKRQLAMCGGLARSSRTPPSTSLPFPPLPSPCLFPTPCHPFRLWAARAWERGQAQHKGREQKGDDTHHAAADL